MSQTVFDIAIALIRAGACTHATFHRGLFSKIRIMYLHLGSRSYRWIFSLFELERAIREIVWQLTNEYFLSSFGARSLPKIPLHRKTLRLCGIPHNRQ